MQQQRNKYLAISALVLLASTVTLFLTSREERSPEIDHSYFSLKDTEQLDMLTLQSPQDTVVLTFEGSRWRVNDRWDADIQMIKVLMATLQQVEPHHTVSSSVMDTVLRQLQRRGTRVVAMQNGIEKMNFLAGGNLQKTESWFLKAGDASPYVVVIPGYRVYVSGIFQMEEVGWRNKRIFEFNWRNFKSLTASYPSEPKSGFTIEMRQRYFGIKEIPRVDTTKLNDYLDAVSLLVANRFVSGSADGLLPQRPAVRIEILDIANRTYTLEMFTPEKDAAEVYGRMADGQVVAFDRSAIYAIARQRAYFVPTEDQ